MVPELWENEVGGLQIQAQSGQFSGLIGPVSKQKIKMESSSVQRPWAQFPVL